MKVVNAKTTKHQDSSILDVFFASFKKNDLPVVDVIPYKRITKEGFLVDKQNEYQAILKVKTTDLVSLNAEDLNRIINQFTNICRVYTEPLKVLSMTYSTETTQQQLYWKARINKYRRVISSGVIDSARYETMLKLALDNYRRVSWVEESLSELTFFFIAYGKTEKELAVRVKDLIRMGGKQFSLQQADRTNIEKILFRLTNMNTEL